MEMVSSIITTEISTLDSFSTMLKQARVNFLGKMVTFIRVNGKTIKNMGWDK
tara:strand:+ start:204 stop:359 length:156 start_codon:yes stop_codon:yes gene_type:complete